MLSKSQVAFRFTAERLFKPGCRVYFWTFTFKELRSDWVQSGLFGDFLNHLRMSFGKDWGGVRVAELHPGGHGVHYHCLINRRLPIDIIMRIGRRYGIGRTEVKIADQNGGTARYLGKYLSKCHDGPKCQSGRSMRRWAKFGNAEHTRVSDVQNVSPMWVYRRERGMTFLGYQNEILLREAWGRGVDEFWFAWTCLVEGDAGPVYLMLGGSQYQVIRQHYSSWLAPRVDKMLQRALLPF